MTKLNAIALSTFFSIQLIAQKEIHTEIIINASPEQVWEVLSDFEAYPEWNPFITEVEGKTKKGEKLKINAGGMTFKPTVLIAEKNSELKWIGRLLMPGIFDGTHRFQIIDRGDGTVLFKHSEHFKGLLVGPFSKKLDRETKSGFDAMNKALKERVENFKK